MLKAHGEYREENRGPETQNHEYGRDEYRKSSLEWSWERGARGTGRRKTPNL